MSDIKIIIDADVKGLEAGTKKVQAELGKTAIAAQKTDSSVAKMGAGLTATGNIAKQAATNISGVGASLLSGGIIAGVALLGVGLLELGKRMIGLSESQKILNDSLDSAKGAYVKSTLLVDDLRAKIDLAKAGFIDKKVALDAYNSTIGKTIGQTKDLNEADQLLIENGPKYVQYMFLRAAANIAATKAADALVTAEIESRKKAEVISRIKTGDKDGIGEFVKRGEENIRAANLLAGQTKAALIKSVSETLEAEAAEIAKGFKKVVEVTKDGGKKYKKAITDAFKVKEDSGPQRNLFLSKPDAPKRAGATVDLFVDLNIEFLDTDDEAFFKGFEAWKKQNRIEELSKDFAEQVEQTISNAFNETMVGVGEVIGNALAGVADGDVDGIFKGLMISVGEQIKDLGKFLITTATIIKVAKESFQKLFANPVAQLVVGIGLVALGQLIKASAAKRYPGFATGVQNFSGGSAIVGERGPELVQLPRGSNVVPNGQLNAMGGQQIFIADNVIRGTDLVTVFRKATAYNSRNGY